MKRRQKALERRIARILRYATRVYHDGKTGAGQTLEEYLGELEFSLRELYEKMLNTPPQLMEEINS